MGVHVVGCIGDKLCCGPQTWSIAVPANLVAALKKEPFFRALRCDKLILAALKATAEHYLGQRGCVPTIEMLNQSIDELRERARKLASLVNNPSLKIKIGSATGQVGGGTLRSEERRVGKECRY